MGWSASTFWWVATGLVVTAELATGTVYLLMIALGLAAAAIAAHLGMAATWQIVVAAVIAGGATAAWHAVRMRRPQAPPAPENRDVNLDVGEQVQVSGWAADGVAKVSHRGSTWSARLKPGAPGRAGPHTVVAVEGNWLVLAPVAQAAPTAVH